MGTPKEVGRRDSRTVWRPIVCTALAVVAAHYTWRLSPSLGQPRDFAQVWFAARAVLAHRDPYALIGPGREFEWAWPFYYPLTAAVAAVPIAPLSQPLAMAVVAFLATFVFAWALSANGFAPLLAFGSWSVWHAIHLVQWSPLLAGALVFPAMSLLFAAKPTVGAALFAARPNWWAIGGVLFLAVAFAVQPSWVSSWRAALASPNVAPHRAFAFRTPISFLGGPLVLVALLRWRRPEARLLVALACVPQTLLPYEGVLLSLVPRGWIESAFLMAMSHLMMWYVRRGPSIEDMAVLTSAYGQAMVALLYLPATLMVLRRPNEGRVPAWLERSVAYLPASLRGRAVRDGATIGGLRAE